MIVSVFIAVLIVILCVAYHNQDKRKWELIKKLPGPKGLPLLGNAHQLKSGHPWYLQLRQWYTKDYATDGLVRLFLANKLIVAIWKSKYVELREWYTKEFAAEGIAKLLLANKLIVAVWKFKYVEAILSSNKHIDKASEYNYLHAWLGTGLLTSTGEKWRHRRKMLTPTFHFNILNDFVDVFNQQARILVDKFKTKEGKGVFNVFGDITHCALDIICETAMGANIDAQSKDTDYVRAVYRMSYLADTRMRRPWYWIDFIYNTVGHGKEQREMINTLHGFTNSVIADRLNSFDQKKAELISQELSGEEAAIGIRKNKRLAFLDMLLYMSDNLTKLSMEDIREEVDTFMFEGHDTTAAAMSWAIHLVGANPEVQKKLHEEMDRIFGDSDRDATMEDLKNMKYMECCIKESLRLFPSVPMYGRNINDDLELGDYTIPKGTTVLVISSAVHRDPDTFPDPEVFKPERFLLENAKNRHPYSYIPFSAGPRNCIGQKFAMLEEKTVLSHVFRNFHIKSEQTREELRPVGDIILRPEEAILIQLTARKFEQE